MGRVVFIGDEVTGAGFRLAGVRAFTPAPDKVADLLTAQGQACDLLLVTAEFAQGLHEGELNKITDASRALIAVVPDVRGTTPPADLETTVRRVLGIEG